MVEEHRDGPLLWLTLDAPERLNAFRAGDYRALRLRIGRAMEDPGIRVLILTGRGRAFSAGADRSLVDGSASPAERTEAKEEFTAFLDALEACDKPLLAAVNGLAVGIGCTLLGYVDLVLASDTARFRLPFTALGITPEAASTVLIPARARWDDTMWAMLSSEWIDSAEARDMGLAWRVVPGDSLEAEATDLGRRLVALDPAAVRATKRLLVAGRRDLARAAVEREMAAMEDLRSGGTRPPGPATSSSASSPPGATG